MPYYNRIPVTMDVRSFVLGLSAIFRWFIRYHIWSPLSQARRVEQERITGFLQDDFGKRGVDGHKYSIVITIVGT